MQDKRFYPYLFLHAGIVTLWVILDRTHKGIANDGAINLLSIAVLLCYFNLLYLHVMTSRREGNNIRMWLEPAFCFLYCGADV